MINVGFATILDGEDNEKRMLKTTASEKCGFCLQSIWLVGKEEMWFFR